MDCRSLHSDSQQIHTLALALALALTLTHTHTAAAATSATATAAVLVVLSHIVIWLTGIDKTCMCMHQECSGSPYDVSPIFHCTTLFYMQKCDSEGIQQRFIKSECPKTKTFF
jgi:hypothetical protein